MVPSLVPASRVRALAWVSWLVASLLFLQVVGNAIVYGVVVPLSAVLLASLAPPSSAPGRVDRRDLAAVAVLYAGVVALFSLAFRYFTQDRTLGLFLCYAAGLLLGVAGPIVYMVWLRGRPLADLGLGRHRWREALALGALLAGVQFLITLAGYALPAPVDWVPLAAMSLTVGLFEAVFFRGFVQGRLEASFGRVAGVGGAAALYALYHVGYGMDLAEMAFLFGLGVVYAVAYACVHNVLVLWPLLLPMGTFYSQLEAGGIRMPWAAILGFADILGLMAAAMWLAHRRERRTPTATIPAPAPRVPAARG